MTSRYYTINYCKLFALILAGELLFTSCEQIMRNTPEVSPIPVEIQVISENCEAGMQNYVGTIEATASSSLSFSVAGCITQVYVHEGQRVAQGQLLAELDSKSFQESHSAAQATLRQAQDAYDRLKQLHEKGSITEVQWVEIETKLAQAKAAEAISLKNLENCKLYAHFSGVVGECELTAGMNTVPGLSVLTLLKINQVNVNIPIPENVISDVRVGMPVQVTVSALGNRRFEGKVQSKGVVANPLSHNYDVIVPLNNRDAELMPGMVCNVQIASSDTTHLITLTNRVVKISHHGSPYVWVVKNGTAQQRMITTGGLSQHGIIIASGLSEGDSVIVNGEHKVSTGTKVKIQ